MNGKGYVHCCIAFTLSEYLGWVSCGGETLRSLAWWISLQSDKHFNISHLTIFGEVENSISGIMLDFLWRFSLPDKSIWESMEVAARHLLNIRCNVKYGAQMYHYHPRDARRSEDRKHGDVFTGQVIICLTLSLSQSSVSAISTLRGKKNTKPGTLNRFIEFLSLMIEIQI